MIIYNPDSPVPMKPVIHYPSALKPSIAVVQQCVDCKSECVLVDYGEFSDTKRVYRFWCENCKNSFKVIETRRRRPFVDFIATPRIRT